MSSPSPKILALAVTQLGALSFYSFGVPGLFLNKGEYFTKLGRVTKMSIYVNNRWQIVNTSYELIMTISRITIV